MKTQGQGHETTFAQIIAEETGIPSEDIDVVHGDTDNTPFGLGTYGSRSTPVSGAAAALVARKARDKAQIEGGLDAQICYNPDNLTYPFGAYICVVDIAAAKAMASAVCTDLLRLQCYEGIAANEALYEWSYARQLLAIRVAESSSEVLSESDLFTNDLLTERPLLAALRNTSDTR